MLHESLLCQLGVIAAAVVPVQNVCPDLSAPQFSVDRRFMYAHRLGYLPDGLPALPCFGQLPTLLEVEVSCLHVHLISSSL